MTYFYPGADLYAGGGGGGGFTSYVHAGVAPVGVLYEAILTGSLAFVLLAGCATAYGVGRSIGRWNGERARRLAGAALLAGAAVGLALAVVVPLAQPALLGLANSGGSCGSLSAAGACASFWGTRQHGGSTFSWGGGLGWWLDVGASGLLTLVLVGRPWRTRATGGSQHPPGRGPRQAARVDPDASSSDT